MTKSKWIIAACAVVAVLAAGSAAYYFWHVGGSPDPAKMNPEQIQAYRRSAEFNSMPRQERRTFFTKVMDAQVEGYFNTPPQDREKYLDKIIDETLRFRPADSNSQRPRGDPNRMRQAQRRFQNASGEQRRLRREKRDPVKDAMRREFFGALRTRAESRGIQMGGGGSRGGF